MCLISQQPCFCAYTSYWAHRNTHNNKRKEIEKHAVINFRLQNELYACMQSISIYALPPNKTYYSIEQAGEECFAGNNQTEQYV